MTTTPAPRRGLFCAHFSALCARFFAPCSHFSGFCGDGQGASFLCKLFETFAVFFVRLFPPFRPFFWWHFAAVSPPFFVLFFALFAGRRARSPRQPEPEAGRDRAALFFYVRFCRVLGIRQHPQSRTNRGRSGTRPAPMFVYAFPVFSCAFTVPFLCRHGCP